MAAPTTYQIPGARPVVQAVTAASLTVARAGHMIHFFGRIVVSIPAMMRYYRREMLRLLADIAWGNGSIVVGGGTVNVALVLGMTSGALVAVEGMNALNLLGLGPATGLVSSFATTRELAPIMIALAFIAQAGCRFTAQLGAMRISEEVDALEVLGINAIAYLVITRVVAAVIAVIPLFLAALATAYLATQLASVAAGPFRGVLLALFFVGVQPWRCFVPADKSRCFVFLSSTIQ